MGMRISDKWQIAREAEMTEFVRSGKHFTTVSSYNPATQWLICRLAARNIPFRLIQIGAGVKQITTETATCPKCHGTGKC